MEFYAPAHFRFSNRALSPAAREETAREILRKMRKIRVMPLSDQICLIRSMDFAPSEFETVEIIKCRQ